MFFPPFEYDMPLYRPPSEARSLILQITLGCSWNKCAFCEMYTPKKFKPRREEDIFREIDAVAELDQDVRRIFLADGNAMVLSFDRLQRIIRYINNKFPNVQRISSYALPKDLLAKSVPELVALREAGLRLLYVGIESGDDEVLRLVNKGETFNSNVEGLLRAREAGIKTSVMILNGLGGKKYWEQHAQNSARVLNEVQPEYAATLVLSFPYGAAHYKKRFSGQYEPMNTLDLFKEMEVFIRNTALKTTIFRSDHASNYLVLKGVLSRDRETMLHKIQEAINNPDLAGLRHDWQRGF